jgi:tryptophanyl-tRNA synthetase
MSLTNPEKKMSKSDPNPKSRILLTDSQEDIRKKVNAALTDSLEGGTFDFARRPGWSNLVQLLYCLEPLTDTGVAQGASPEMQDKPTTLEDLSAELAKHSKRALKEKVANAIESVFAPMREVYLESMNTAGGLRKLDEASATGAEKARLSAEKTMTAIKEAIGL